MVSEYQKSYMKTWNAAHKDWKRDYMRAWHAKNKDKHLEYMRKWRITHAENTRRTRYKSKYGISLESLAKLLNFQHSACAICGKSLTIKTIALDHNHVTEEIRGILCQICNAGLGHFNDNPNLLEKAAEYLRT